MKSVQLLACVDYLMLVARTKRELLEIFFSLEG